jgi:maltose alpha-D-glucosyltransferase/alpha-amylase
MIHTRKKYNAFGRGDFQWIDCYNEAIAAYARTYEDQSIFVFNNLSASEQLFSIPMPDRSSPLTDLLTEKEYHIQEGSLTLRMTPRQYLWLV